MKPITKLKNLQQHFRELFLILGIAPLIFIMIMGILFSYIELKKESFSKLNIARNTVKKEILSQFTKIKNDAVIFKSSHSAHILSKYFLSITEKNLFLIHQKMNVPGYEKKGELNKSLNWILTFQKQNQYSDILFLDNNQIIKFSLKNPGYIGTDLSDAGEHYAILRNVADATFLKKDIHISDLYFFHPEDETFSFVGVPLTGAGGKIFGIYIFFYPGKNFSNIAHYSIGQNKTLETYLAGEDTYFRTASRFLPNAPLKLKVNTEAMRKGLKHQSGNEIILDYRGIPVLSSYTFMGLDESLNLNFDWIIFSEIDVFEAFQPFLSLLTTMSLITFILILINIYTSKKFSKEITTPISDLAQISGEIATGNFHINLSKDSRFYEFELIYKSFDSMIHTFQKISSSMQTLSSGNTNIEINENEINPIIKSMNRVIRSLDDYSNQAMEVSRGNYDLLIQPRSVEDKLGNSLIKMTKNLKSNQEAIRSNDWIRNGRTIISEIAHDTSDIKQMTFAYLMFFTDYLMAEAGVFYTANHEASIPELNLTALYGIPSEYHPAKTIKKDDGISGSFLNHSSGIKILENIEGNYLKYGSGLGEGNTGNILILPFRNSDQTLGLIELLFTKEISQETIEFFEETQSTISSSLSIAFKNAKSFELLEKTTSQAEELQAQQEELRVINEELGEKNKILESQKKSILEKNQSLEEVSEELERKANELGKANQYKSEFLANMSHELRTPLNSLLLLSGKLEKNKDGNLTERQIKSLNVIHQSGNSLLNLINEILDLAKIEAGRMELHLAETSIEGFINDIKEIFQAPFQEKNIELKIILDNDAPRDLITDAQKLIQILRNLISNALKFTSSGSVTVSFQKLKVGQNDHLMISVKDTGIGISEDKLNLIFQAFQQLDGSISRTYGGTGLGLTISKEMVKQLSGFIEVESREHSGSEFRIFLPLDLSRDQKTEDPHSEQQNINQRPSPQASDKNLKSDVVQKNILLIEDDLNYAHVLMDLCKTKGFHSIYASSGEAGLQIAQTQKIDAVILDYKLPDLTGEEVLARLKSSPETKNIPVQILSGFDRADSLLKKGAVGYLKKPATETQIFESLDIITDILAAPISRLLILEPNLDLKRILQEIFKKEINADFSDDPKEALELLHHNNYSCIIIDIDQKNFNLFEYIERIKDRTPKLPPVIIFTEKELTEDENVRLNEIASSIVIKQGKSLERLKAESLLFLDAVSKNQEELVASDQQNKNHRLKGKKALIIDDDMRNLFALAEELSEEEMIVVKASGGRQALMELEKNSSLFDIIISDIMMPEMDGYETIRRIRKMGNYRDTPVIALTAKAMKEDRQLCIQAGASEYITKPVDREKLFYLINSLIWNN
ncbi:MAG: response regulator [Spirochaetia bacterium]|nr:response regulator [Spirochaetia bacterium]